MLFLLPSCLSSKHMKAHEVQAEIALREMRSVIEDQKYHMSRLEVELEIIEGKADSLISSTRQLRQDMAKLNKNEKEFYQTTWVQYEAKLKELMSFETSLKDDLESYKEKAGTILSTLSHLKSKIDDNENALLKQSQEILHLQNSLTSLLDIVNESDQGSMFYVVQSGDTLEKIAGEHRVSVEDLRQMNALSSNLIVVGQKLRLK